MKSARSLIAAAVFTVGLTVPAGHAQDGAAETNEETAERVQQHWLKLSRDYAESITLTTLEDGAKPFRLYEKPVFLHTQSVRGDDIGAVHLWLTDDKRPAVVGVVFAWSNSASSRMVCHEFHSLVQQPISLSAAGRLRWTSRSKGFEWKPFPDKTPPPAEKRLHQRLQVKQLARRFTANTTTDKNQRWELRAVPTPIYEYQSTSAGVAHGALFAFCQGTDTELLLLIEACRDSERGSEKQGSLAWRFGLAPFSDYKIRAALDQVEIWESPPGTLGENGKPHFWNTIEQRPKPDFETAQN